MLTLNRPKVLSAKDLASSKTANDFKMYDAIPEETQQAGMAVDTPSLSSAEMDKFLPMLNDYLKSEFPCSSLLLFDLEFNLFSP